MSRRVPCPDWLDSSRRFTPTQASRPQKKARLSALATATLLAASIGVFAQTDEVTQPQGAISETGIAITTQVSRVAENGELVALRLLPSPDPQGFEVESSEMQISGPNNPGLSDPDAPTLLPDVVAQPAAPAMAEAEAAVGAWNRPADVPVGLEESKPDSGLMDAQKEQPGALEEPEGFDTVVAGDRLRYELTVHNTNRFTVPALALEVVEQVAVGVELVSPREQLSTADARGWLEAKKPEEIIGAEVVGAPGDAETQTLRWLNTRPLAPGEQILLTYDVIVLPLTKPQSEPTEESRKALDLTQPQLQLPD